MIRIVLLKYKTATRANLMASLLTMKSAPGTQREHTRIHAVHRAVFSEVKALRCREVHSNLIFLRHMLYR
jgi:hypothetical protein